MVDDQLLMQKQTQHVDSMSANFGGTEMLAALEKVFRSRCAQLPTSCFVLTDGEVSILGRIPLDTY